MDQFNRLDKAIPSWKPGKTWGFNKVMKHYIVSGLGRQAGTPAYWYDEYRSGRVSKEDAVRQLARELPNAQNVLGTPID